MKRSFAAACQRAGLEDFHPQRPSPYLCGLVGPGGSVVWEVAELLRHADIHITMCYAHLAPENMRAAVR
ncbi:site-specific recombinase XerD [Methylocaldum marinum]|uniref:Site-specific recombinase XerD n=1 Tax=Methylocaldum marinum TaxID=1432792 RepID=A0A250KUY9_9GAMM|nr:site-specific integrase [Methylocaldum marinum]BBA33599.1 site-specific recombinase XerD [Methylocaldum marinum]